MPELQRAQIGPELAGHVGELELNPMFAAHRGALDERAHDADVEPVEMLTIDDQAASVLERATDSRSQLASVMRRDTVSDF
jgi:hypothetical protein